MSCCSDPANWKSVKDRGRPGWLRYHCARCFGWLGYKPEDTTDYYKKKPKRGGGDEPEKSVYR